MNRSHDCTAVCAGLCHLNELARARYLELMRGGCPEQAETLRRDGVWA